MHITKEGYKYILLFYNFGTQCWNCDPDMQKSYFQRPTEKIVEV